MADAVQRLGDFAVAIAARHRRRAMERGIEDLGHFVVGERLDRIVEDAPQPIGRFAIRIGRGHDDHFGPRARAVDQADRDRPFVADRRTVEDHDRGVRLVQCRAQLGPIGGQVHVAAEAAQLAGLGTARWRHRDCTG